MKKLFAIIFIIFIILAGTTVYQFVKKDKYNLVLEIDKDKPLKESLSVLPVSNNPFFKLYLKFRNDGKDIKAGNYELRGKFNMIELVSMLESGKSKVFKFTIIEGNTVKNVIDKLVADGKGKRENFEKVFKEIDFSYPTPDGNFEGYLYPETYFIPESYDEKSIINIFLKEFLKKFPVESYPDKDEFYQKLIMASILEREAAVESEKPIMASVFYNRIAKNMTLSADSTVNFVFNYEKKRIYYKDLEVDSPYNTYKNKGLPPGPICNPTVSSVEAAYHPADTEYLFFVTKGGGEHFFSKTYKEHLDFQKNK
ncbi:endolytic transglycosylase MltG [Fusobacterium nucleatum]|uniref:endolytic transglycosylase MltG n=1 Tax=Fusobacterium vincentii TaxID=155615 RepID=UPI000401CB3D|nr:endolytic transglycosylase MltG [Fusobacterium vincentii]ALF20389.1 4-amino-4-deoxychorismate lyase [Fusobacterium vincentii ChDC F8]PIH01852.1 endolytic transglycosylase MltG [Fusobacterium vincentii]